jgi:hypothetical protein
MISLNGKEVIMHQMLLRSLVQVNQATRTAVLKPTDQSFPPPSELEEIVKRKKKLEKKCCASFSFEGLNFLRGRFHRLSFCKADARGKKN